jgi:hypothetical protein
VVATSRNDNHGGYLTHRMQHFVDGFVAQCRRHDVRAELLLVEWNPPPDRKPLVDELQWPDDLGPCEIRIVTVPPEVHLQLPHADKLPLFQMIAKNVGIRRARGHFVLATNVDILFSDPVMRFMRDELREGCLYRADRCDVPTEVPDDVPFEQVLRFCEEKAFRLHATGFTLIKQPDGRWKPSSPLAAVMAIAWTQTIRALLAPFRALIRRLQARARRPVQSRIGGRLSWRRIVRGGVRSMGTVIRSARYFAGALAREVRSAVNLAKWAHQALVRRELFTNACGDFTLMSKGDWEALHGYPEWPIYSWHLDSLLLYQANSNGMKEVYLGKRARVYHIEHAPGSGFTPEHTDKLFERLDARCIPYLDWAKDVKPMIDTMDEQRKAGVRVLYNEESWGYAAQVLLEMSIDGRMPERAAKASAAAV